MAIHYPRVANYKKDTQILLGIGICSKSNTVHIHRGVDTAMNTYFMVHILCGTHTLYFYSIKNNIFNIYILSLIADSTTVSIRGAFHQSAYAVNEFQGEMFKYLYKL